MTVLDNVAIGAYLRGATGVVRAALGLDRAEEARTRAEAARAIARVGLGGHMFDAAGSLPLGKQRIVEIARALAADPRCCCSTSRRRDCATSKSRSSRSCCAR